MKRTSILVLLAVPALACAQSMEPGEWQFVSTMTTPLMPTPQTSVITQCVTPQEAADPTRFTAKEQGVPDCQVTPGVRTASSYSWTVSCPSQGMTGKGTAKFSRGQVESEMQITLTQPGNPPMQMSTRMLGKHTGPCKTK